MMTVAVLTGTGFGQKPYSSPNEMKTIKRINVVRLLTMSVTPAF